MDKQQQQELIEVAKKITPIIHDIILGYISTRGPDYNIDQVWSAIFNGLAAFAASMNNGGHYEQGYRAAVEIGKKLPLIVDTANSMHKETKNKSFKVLNTTIKMLQKVAMDGLTGAPEKAKEDACNDIDFFSKLITFIPKDDDEGKKDVVGGASFDDLNDSWLTPSSLHGGSFGDFFSNITSTIGNAFNSSSSPAAATTTMADNAVNNFAFNSSNVDLNAFNNSSPNDFAFNSTLYQEAPANSSYNYFNTSSPETIEMMKNTNAFTAQNAEPTDTGFWGSVKNFVKNTWDSSSPWAKGFMVQAVPYALGWGGMLGLAGASMGVSLLHNHFRNTKFLDRKSTFFKPWNKAMNWVQEHVTPVFTSIGDALSSKKAKKFYRKFNDTYWTLAPAIASDYATHIAYEDRYKKLRDAEEKKYNYNKQVVEHKFNEDVAKRRVENQNIDARNAERIAKSQLEHDQAVQRNSNKLADYDAAVEEYERQAKYDEEIAKAKKDFHNNMVHFENQQVVQKYNELKDNASLATQGAVINGLMGVAANTDTFVDNIVDAGTDFLSFTPKGLGTGLYKTGKAVLKGIGVLGKEVKTNANLAEKYNKEAQRLLDMNDIDGSQEKAKLADEYIRKAVDVAKSFEDFDGQTFAKELYKRGWGTEEETKRMGEWFEYYVNQKNEFNWRDAEKFYKDFDHSNDIGFKDKPFLFSPLVEETPEVMEERERRIRDSQGMKMAKAAYAADPETANPKPKRMEFHPEHVTYNPDNFVDENGNAIPFRTAKPTESFIRPPPRTKPRMPAFEVIPPVLDAEKDKARLEQHLPELKMQPIPDFVEPAMPIEMYARPATTNALAQVAKIWMGSDKEKKKVKDAPPEVVPVTQVSAGPRSGASAPIVQNPKLTYVRPLSIPHSTYEPKAKYLKTYIGQKSSTTSSSSKRRPSTVHL